MSKREWLQNLKKGDKAVEHFYRQETRIVTVLRLTKTQVITTQNGWGENRWRKKDGYEVGGSTFGSRRYITKPSAEDIARIGHKDLFRKVYSYVRYTLKIDDLSPDKLREVAKLLGVK